MNIFSTDMESDRLHLRNLSQADVKDMFEYSSNPEVTKYLEWDAHKDIKQTKHFIERSISENKNSDNSFVWGIELKEHAKLIGVLRIYDYSPKNRRAEISYILNPAYSGKGYMSEAILLLFEFCFTKCNLNRIQAKCSVFNTGSEKVMQRTGMLYEGLMKEYTCIHEKFHNELLYAITSDGYFKNI
ncbi:MAG: GNAT family N-acetyltransferase [Bacteroidales bacterium]|nr:GNAT family N-acetyltransferase [Bacteroidales bacterium]